MKMRSLDVNFHSCYVFSVPNRANSERISTAVLQSLRTERIRKGISMNRLARRAGVSQSMISLLERGARNPTLGTLLRIATALDEDLSKVIKLASNAVKSRH
jgi:predicted transcriptional regulator